MTDHDKWNQGLITETIAVLQKTRETVDDAIERLHCYLRQNPGWPTLPPAPGAVFATEEDAAAQ